MYANAIAQIEPPDVGIHLIWVGPHVWVYSPTGWAIQRREHRRQHDRVICDELDRIGIAKLRLDRERPSPLGIFTLRDGLWPVPVVPTSGAHTVPCDVFTLQLDAARRMVQITVKARHSFAVALREGKVVAVEGPKSGSTTFELRAVAIDTVIWYAIIPISLRCCVDTPNGDEDRDWEDVPFLVKNLQLPLKELMPALDSPDEEFAEGKSRLLTGESLDPEEFRRLTSSLRPGVQRAGPPRPLDQVLLMREDPTEDYEELIALDPIRVLLSHPKWRRVLGFGWFDDDRSLEEGKTYEYRITGHFPAQDLNDKVYGFHSTPSQTALPADFMLQDLRLRLPEPVAVQRAPDTAVEGTIQITRRGIPIQPRQNRSWVLIPSLEDNSLVIDFPSPITSVIFELHKEQQFTYTAHAFFGGVVFGPEPLPPGERPRVNFPFPIRQMRLQGNGFLFAVRIPSGLEGLQPLSVVLPPVLLKNTPRPEPPVQASISNLQQTQPPPIPDNTPPSTPPTRPALGFEVTWRPALRDGIAVWPPDADAAPPLDAALFQIEHREEHLLPLGPFDLSFEGEFSVATRLSRATPRLSAELLEAVAKAPIMYEHRESLIRALASGDTATVHSLLLLSASEWTPVVPEENLTLGDRSGSAQTIQIRIHPGANVMSVFPEVPRPGNGESLDLVWADVFDFEEGGQEVDRPVPSPGTHHRYRVRAVDAIGRPSPSWTETNLLRLEKHVPPPVPVGPDQTPADTLTLPRPSGVQAKVIVKDAPGLTPDDVALLGTDDNIVVLRWGWHANQREQDPFATEFRVYVTTKPLDVVPGVLTAANEIGLGVYEVTIQLERAVVADAAKNAPLEAGYPFVIYSHTAGQTITAMVGTRVPDANGNLRKPALGPVKLYTHLTPDLTRPPAWTERVEVQPITTASEYQNIFRNLLTLTPEHPKDSIWVGVSSADDQFYVPDQLAPVESRPGNESAIVPVVCEGRYHGRPNFSIPPALDPVPVLITPEPTDRAIQFALDLTPFLGATGLGNSNRIRPERVSAAAVFNAYYTTTSNQIIARAIDPHSGSETDIEVIVPNPNDRQAVLDALNGNDVDALKDRFVVFLAGSHPYADRLFEPVMREAVPLGKFQETLPPLGERYVYRVRLSDAAGHLSAGGAMAALVVRVPTMTAGVSPLLVPREPADDPGLLRIRLGPDPSVTHLLTFQQLVTNGNRPATEASVVRIPNLPEAYPAVGIQLRAPDGTLLSSEVKLLSDSDVVVDADGFRNISLSFSSGPAERLQIWACTVSRDGVPSILAGPWELAMPPAPLPVPTLVATQVASDVIFAWTWPAGDHTALEVALERSLDGTSWHRFTPMLGETAGSYVYTPPAAGILQYRIVVTNTAGRKAFGDPITAS